jgi:hypothetical protein
MGSAIFSISWKSSSFQLIYVSHPCNRPSSISTQTTPLSCDSLAHAGRPASFFQSSMSLLPIVPTRQCWVLYPAMAQLLSPVACEVVPLTIRNLEIYDVSRVTYKTDVIDLTYLWRYIEFCHRTLVGPRWHQTRWHFYDDGNIYRHKLKWEIIIDYLQVLWWIINHHYLKREIVMDWLHNGPNCK